MGHTGSDKIKRNPDEEIQNQREKVSEEDALIKDITTFLY